MEQLDNKLIQEIISSYKALGSDYDLETYLKDNYNLFQDQHMLQGSTLNLHYQAVFKELKHKPSSTFLDLLNSKDEHWTASKVA